MGWVVRMEVKYREVLRGGRSRFIDDEENYSQITRKKSRALSAREGERERERERE